jgi:hypothetical protein
MGANQRSLIRDPLARVNNFISTSVLSMNKTKSDPERTKRSKTSKPKSKN